MNSLNYKQIFRGLTAICILVIFLLPHLVMEWVTEALHALLELIVELAHVVFEWVEISLDGAIEFLFETELHDTQIIVFYIIMSVLSLIVYRLMLFVPDILRRLRDRIWAYLLGQKTRFANYWQGLSLLKKIWMVAIVIGVAYLYVLVSF